MNTLAASATLFALRHGDALTANAKLKLQLSTGLPVTFDFHWLRSLAGSFAGSTGLRFDSVAATYLHLDADCRATVRRQDRKAQPWLQLTLEDTRPVSAAPCLSISSSLPTPEDPDPLHLALLGEHPRQLLRSILKSLGGPDFTDFVRDSGICSRLLAEFAALWPTLTATSEPVLWKAAGDPAQLSAIRDATLWFANHCPSPLALHDQLTGAATLIVQWFDALTGSPVSAHLSDSAFNHAKIAASNCLPLLQMPEFSNILRRVFQTLPTAPSGSSPASRDLARRLYGAAGCSLAGTLCSESTRSVLLDASFRMDEVGLDLYYHALAGNLTPLFASASPSVEISQALLLNSRLRPNTIEIHLPYLISSSREKELVSMASTEVVSGPNCRLTVVRAATRSTSSRKGPRPSPQIEQQARMIIAASLSTGDREPANDNFSLGFSDVRHFLPGHDRESYLNALSAYGINGMSLPSGPFRATLDITLPGSVVQAWARLPLARCESLAPLLCRVSLALQITLRRWVPVLYHANRVPYATPSVALPLLAYQFSRPYARIGRRHYSYDFMDSASIRNALSTAARHIEAPLERIHSRLTAAGQTTLAARYDPQVIPEILRSVLVGERHFAALLAADSFFIEQVLSLARYARDLSTTAAKSPGRSARDLHIFTTSFVKVFQRRLARLFAGQDFTALGPLLLIEATAALADRRDALKANLTIEPGQDA